ncbi:hypothetical protein A2899_03110 [Candidatus Amesbacteria bacterium RIFCSPLOWO2_01_FULL_49_25]|nr:MAG: hypothetical protein A2899_03110 [Candidatus Amesbacteria bacterium RIFCSPLOWO2_01_FULL_49_25]
MKGVKGAERQLARAHEVYADIARTDSVVLRNPKDAARRNYQEAISILEEQGDYDGIAKITPKLVDLGRGE